MGRIEETIKELNEEQDQVKILSLLKIDSGLAEQLKDASNFEDLLSHLQSFESARNNLDVQFLSKRLMDKLQLLFHDKHATSLGIGNLSDRHLKERFLKEKNPLALTMIVKKMTTLDDDDSLHRMNELLSDEDARVRATTVEFFAKNYADLLVSRIPELLQDDSNRVRGNAILFISPKDPDLARQSITEMLNHSSIAMRESALYCLENLPHDPLFQPYIETLSCDPYPNVAIRALSLFHKYHSKDFEQRLIEQYFVCRSKQQKQAIREIWGHIGIPYEVQGRIAREGLSKEYEKLGIKVFEELQAIEPYDPSLRSHYFLILRQQDHLKVILDNQKPDKIISTDSIKDGIKGSYIALGKTAYELHKKEEFFFDEVESVTPSIEKLLKAFSRLGRNKGSE